MKRFLILTLLIQATLGFDFWKISSSETKSTITPEYTWDGGDFSIIWKIDNDVLTLTMQAKTNGWISCGICQSDSMSNCDFWTGWVEDSSNTAVLLDTWSTGESRPKEDHMDLTFLNATQSGGLTSITFSRPMKTKDTSHDYDIRNSIEVVGWASHPKDGTASKSYSQHNKAGWIYINFVTGSTYPVNKLDPGMLLALIVFGFLLLWGTIHTARKAYKTYEKYQVRKELQEYPHNAVTSIEASSEKEVPLQDMKSQGHYAGSEDKAVLQYARPKEPVIGCFNAIEGALSKKIPYTNTPVGMVALLVAYIGVNIGCLYFSKNAFAPKVGDILGVNILFLTIPATRNSLLVYLLGVPFERAIRFHRWLGRFTLCLAITHFALNLADWKTATDINDQLKLNTNIYGLIALGILVLLFLTSFDIIRRKAFELFYYLHFLFILFWIFSFLHHEKLQIWVGASVGIYAVDKVMRLVWGTLPQKTSDFKIKGSGKDQILQIRLKKSELANLLHLYDVGQYVFVNFPKINILEWHPFSVSSGPGETTLEINIKGIGNYTEKLLEEAAKEKSLTVRVEGPYGTLNVNYRRFPVIVLVGGGIGVTPMLGILKDLAGTGNLDPDYFGGKSFVKRLHFVWVVPSFAVYDWFGDEIQEAIKALSKTGTEAHFSIYVTREKNMDGKDAIFHAGRPAIPDIMKNIMSDAKGTPVGVFVCGPKPMMDDVWDSVNSHRLEGETIHLHKETFEL